MLTEDNAARKKYAIICPLQIVTTGLGAVTRLVMSKVIKASNLGYVPIVDLKHMSYKYFKDGRKLKDNAWEYFFKQPCGVSLDIINQLEDTSQIFCWDNEIEMMGNPLTDEFFALNPKYAKTVPYLEEHMKFLQFSDEFQSYIDDNYKKIVGDETEILGILCRGTDYINYRPLGHIIPATPAQLIKEAKELMEKYHYKKIYVATEDKQIYETFKKEFGDMLLPNTQYMYDKYENADKTLLAQIKVDRPDHHYKLAIEYLFSMYILSKCKYFIASNECSGLYFVCVFSTYYKDMKYVHVWERGRYKYRTKIGYSNFWQRIFSVKNEVYENIVRKVITILGIKIKFIKEIK